MLPASPGEAGGASPWGGGVPHKGEALPVIDTSPTRHQAAKRGRRIADDFMPSKASIEWARSEFPTADLKRITEEFIDYWASVPGQRGVKLDWDRTWKNRVRDVASRQTSRPQRRDETVPHYWAGVVQ